MSAKELMTWITPVLFVCIVAEMLWSWRKKRAVYNAKETASNLTIYLGYQVLKPVTVAWTIAVLTWVGQFRLWQIPTTAASIITAILVVDFLYYWQHRLNHEIKLLWTVHNVHHSSPWMNLTTSMRLNWMGGFLTPLYYIPAALLGFSVQSILLFFLVNLFFQFFLHTESVDKLPLVEGLVNTPSAHRVHHGSNPLYIDKNYGGLLMVWDRMFGTYQPETEKVRYGVTTGFQGHNPIKAVFGPMWDYLRGNFARESTLSKENPTASSPGTTESAASKAPVASKESRASRAGGPRPSRVLSS